MRHATVIADLTQGTFQSTHSAGNATNFALQGVVLFGNFNPRIPQGMRPHLTSSVIVPLHFNPRIPQGMRRRGAKPPRDT